MTTDDGHEVAHGDSLKTTDGKHDAAHGVTTSLNCETKYFKNNCFILPIKFLMSDFTDFIKCQILFILSHNLFLPPSCQLRTWGFLPLRRLVPTADLFIIAVKYVLFVVQSGSIRFSGHAHFRFSLNEK